MPQLRFTPEQIATLKPGDKVRCVWPGNPHRVDEYLTPMPRDIHTITAIEKDKACGTGYRVWASGIDRGIDASFFFPLPDDMS